MIIAIAILFNFLAWSLWIYIPYLIDKILYNTGAPRGPGDLITYPPYHDMVPKREE